MDESPFKYQERPAFLAGRFVIWSDVQITRRKRYFIVENEHGDTVKIFMRVNEALEYLDDAQIREYWVVAPDRSYLVTVQSVSHDERS